MRSKKIWSGLVLASSLLFACGEPPAKVAAPAAAPVAQVEEQESGFTNPIIPNGADPWLQFYNGNYYATTTTWSSQLVMRKSPTLAGLATATPVNIWSESAADRCCNFWAFEFHRLLSPKGYRWYVMYTSGTKDNYDGQHLSVIESEGDDPMGPYTYKGSPMPKSWNIDGTYLQLKDAQGKDQLYLLWSEWQKDEQLIWIAKMTNPWTITGERKVISRPTHEWEQASRKVNEGPEVLQKNGKTFIVFSASFCETPDYKLGVMELSGTDPLADNAWHKFDQPFFSQGNGVYGPGHNGFFKSPDGKEDWLVYHGNPAADQGCDMHRALRAQKFDWQQQGDKLLPHFGEPEPAGKKLAVPSGENGPLVTRVEGTRVQLINKANQLCITSLLENNQASVTQSACSNEASHWTLDYTTAGQYRLVNAQGLFLTQQDDGNYSLEPWHNTASQQWKIANAEAQLGVQSALSRLVNAHSHKALVPKNCSANAQDCSSWRIQPEGAMAISSIQNGKVISVAEPLAGAKKPAAIEVDEWNKKATQRWQFAHVENGFYNIKNQQQQCVALADKAIVPGNALVVGDCADKTAQWALEFLDNGTQKITNRVSGLVIDLASCGVANHTLLAQAPYLNTICQQFRLLPVAQ